MEYALFEDLHHHTLMQHGVVFVGRYKGYLI